MRGENNPKWNGGWVDYYGCNWEFQRKQRLKIDDYECWLCGKRQPRLNVHHQIPFTKCDDYIEANDLSNLVTLCDTCHCIAERQLFVCF
jgi:5-methylcytosine-specific restriction endonuclease McrA